MPVEILNTVIGMMPTRAIIMPMPQTLKIILRFFLLSVMLPLVLVNKNNELYANSKKKIIALILWIMPLIVAGIANVPINSVVKVPLKSQGNKQISQPQTPAIVQIISSYLSYP